MRGKDLSSSRCLGNPASSAAACSASSRALRFAAGGLSLGSGGLHIGLKGSWEHHFRAANIESHESTRRPPGSIQPNSRVSKCGCTVAKPAISCRGESGPASNSKATLPSSANNSIPNSSFRGSVAPT